MGTQLAMRFLLSLVLLFNLHVTYATTNPTGIYISQTTLEDTKQLKYLIERAKKVGLMTFVVDLELPSAKAKRNIALIIDNKIKYVARIIIFPDGGNHEQVTNKAIWQKKYNLMKTALEYGAESIQIDYIRYSSKQKPTRENAENVAKVVEWFKTQLGEKIPLQIDVFGITSFGPELRIGQDLKLIAKNADVICPMVYPSHYEPYLHHAERPYETVYDSLKSVKAQFNHKLNFKLYPFIELSNYRYPLSREKKLAYIRAQINAVEDAGADGWYAWSASNYYDNLFTVLENKGRGD